MNEHFNEDCARHNEETENALMARKCPGATKVWHWQGKLVKPISRAPRAKKEGNLYLSPNDYDKFKNGNEEVWLYVIDIDIDKFYEFGLLKWLQGTIESRLVMRCQTYMPELVNNVD